MIEARGHNGHVAFDGDYVHIQRKGFLARATAGKGDKRIPITSITAVQWKPAGAFVNGFLQFTIPGGTEGRSRPGASTVDASKDENSVIFTRKQQPAFEALRATVEDAVVASLQTAGPVAAAPSIPEQIQQLAGLRDQGLITPDEYEAKKAELLARL